MHRQIGSGLLQYKYTIYIVNTSIYPCAACLIKTNQELPNCFSSFTNELISVALHWLYKTLVHCLDYPVHKLIYILCSVPLNL